MESIAHRLRRLRTAHQLTLKEVAYNINTPVTTYRDWEYGKSIRGEPYPALAKLYGITLNELITGEKPNVSHSLARLEVIMKNLEELKSLLIALY